MTTSGSSPLPEALRWTTAAASATGGAAALLLAFEIARTLSTLSLGAHLTVTAGWLALWLLPLGVLLGAGAGAALAAARALAKRAPRRRQGRAFDLVCAGLALPYLLFVVNDATSGAWISTRPWITPGRALATGAAFAAVAAFARLTRRRLSRPGASWPWIATLLLLAAACVAINAKVRVGQYPHLHQCVALTALGSLTLGALHMGLSALSRSWALRALLAAAAAAGLGAQLANRSGTDQGDMLARDVALHRLVSAGHLIRIPWQLAPPRSLLEARGIDEGLLARMLAARPVQPPAQGQRPDIVLLTLCTLRRDHTSLADYARDTTPHLRALAQESVVFDRAYTPGPKTVLSIPPALAGVYAATHFLGGERAPGITQMLEGGGYAVHHDLEQALRARQGAQPILVRVHFDQAHHPYTPATRPFGDAPVDLYDSELQEVDARVGAVVGLFPGAVIAMLSDHGEEFGDHGGEQHGHRLYDELIRGLLLLRAPGLAPRRVSAPVSTADMTPTLLELAGLTPPASVEAWSLLPLAHGAPQPGRPPVFVSTPHSLLKTAWRPPAQVQSAVVDGDWKLIYDSVYGNAELYHLATDPGERINRLPSEPTRAGAMLDLLATYRRYVANRAGVDEEWIR